MKTSAGKKQVAFSCVVSGKITDTFGLSFSEFWIYYNAVTE